MMSEKKVTTVSDYAGKLSGSKFGLGNIGGDVGYGVRYIDKREEIVWLGPQGGARKAAAYYLGVIDAFKHGVIGDLPADVNAVRYELSGKRWSQPDYDRGMSAANHYMQYRISDEDFSLSALEAMPVLDQLTSDNVVFNNGAIKITLARTGVADGEPYDHRVTIQVIETTDNGNRWKTYREYQAK